MKGNKLRNLFIAYGIYIVLLVLIVLFSLLRPQAFLSSDNIFNILRQVAVVGISSAGMMDDFMEATNPEGLFLCIATESEEQELDITRRR